MSKCPICDSTLVGVWTVEEDAHLECLNCGIVKIFQR